MRPRAPRASAVQSRHRIRELQRVPQGHVCKNSITKRAVKHVARAGGIGAVNHKRGQINKAAVHPGQRAQRPQSHGGNRDVVFLLDHFERAERVALMGPLHRELGTGHQIIHVGQHPVEPVINGIHVHGNRDVMLVGDLGGAGHRGSVVGIDMQHARVGDFLRSDARRLQPQAFVALPKNRPFAGALIDEDVGSLVSAILSNLEVIQVDAALPQARKLYAATFVVPNCTYVFDLQTELGASHHGAGHLPARAEDLAFERHFPGVCRKVRQQDQGVGGVQSDSNHIEFSHKLIAY